MGRDDTDACAGGVIVGLLRWLGVEVEEYVSFDEIMSRYRDTVEAIREYVADEKRFGDLYLPIIERLARYVYTLPASERHHHAESGGLFEHSIQVAMNGMRAFDARPIRIRDGFGYTVVSETHREMPRWKLALFVALLLHDVGKVFTMTVRAGGREWDPLTKGLYDFLKRDAGTFSYEVEWVRGRGRTHEKFTPLVFPFLVGKREREVLGLHLCAMIVDAITPMPQQDNWMRGFVALADQESVEAAQQEAIASVAAGAPSAVEAEGKVGAGTPPPPADAGVGATGRFHNPRGDIFGAESAPDLGVSAPSVEGSKKEEGGDKEDGKGALPTPPSEEKRDTEEGKRPASENNEEEEGKERAIEKTEAEAEEGDRRQDKLAEALARALRARVEKGLLKVNGIDLTKPFVLILGRFALVSVRGLKEVWHEATGEVVSADRLPNLMERLYAAGVVGRVAGSQEEWFAKAFSEETGKNHLVAFLARPFVVQALGVEENYAHQLRVPGNVEFVPVDAPRPPTTTEEHEEEARVLVAEFLRAVLEKSDASDAAKVWVAQDSIRSWMKERGATPELAAVCLKLLRREGITTGKETRKGKRWVCLSLARAKEWLGSND